VGVKDVESAWLAFCGKNDGALLLNGVSGQWQKYCVSWRNNEARDRAKTAERSGARLTEDGLDPASAEASARRRRREDEELDRALAEKLEARGGA
jgi:hypothetical protein